MGTSIARQFRHFLCPVDFSAYSRIALRYAFGLARRSKGRLTVLFVNDPLLEPAAAAMGYDLKALDAKTGVELRRFVARAIGVRSAAVAIETALGQPAAEIRKAAEGMGADLVIMGSRGLTGPGRWFFGSTTERVLRTTSVPVLVIPKKDRRRAGGTAMRSWPGKRILVPVDLQDYAVDDVREAIAVVRAFRATAMFVSVIPEVRFPPWLKVDSHCHDDDRLEAAKKQLEKLVQTVGGDGECRVVIGEPANQITESAADARIGLIVLTLKRASVPFAPRQGTITYRVLSTEVAPILALPQKARRSAKR